MDANAPPTAPHETHPVPHVPLIEIFKLFFSVGAFSFGGGLLAWVYREVVEKRKWLSEQEFLSGLTLAQVLPGINMTNIAVFIGQRLRGTAGVVAAFVGLLLFPFFFILALLQVYHQLIVIPGVQNFLDGMAVTAIGLIMSVCFKSMRVAVTSIAPAAFIVIIVVTVGLLRWPLVPVALALAPVSVALAYRKVRQQNA